MYNVLTGNIMAVLHFMMDGATEPEVDAVARVA